MTTLVRVAALLGLSLLGTLALSQSAFAFGALAIQSDHGGAVGWAHNYNTKADAEDRAMSECGTDCTVVLDFWNGCAAYSTDQSSGSTAYGWGTGASEDEAEGVATDQCSAHGGNSCVNKVWACEKR